MNKSGSEQASNGVTLNLVCGHLTLAKPKQIEHPKSMTLSSGVAPRTGKLFETTRPLFRTATGVFLLDINFSYSCKATGSYLIPCATYFVENALGCISDCTKFGWFSAFLQ